MGKTTEAPAGYRISTDPLDVDLQFVHTFLSTKSYWAQGRTIETVQKSVENSLCFSALSPDGKQVGFARVVTDYATFAWVCDVFVDAAHRGKGLGKELMNSVVHDSRLQGLTRMILATRDAQALYKEYGCFGVLKNPERWMERSTGED